MRRLDSWFRVAGCLIVLLGGGLVAGPASAGPRDRQDRREERRDDRQDRREERREDRQDRRDDRRDDRQDRREDRRDDRRDRRAEEEGGWKERHEARVASRGDRREQRRSELGKKWGDILDQPAASAELRVHGRRVARLERVVFVAEANGKSDVAAKARILLEREDARHAQRMAHVRGEVAK